MRLHADGLPESVSQGQDEMSCLAWIVLGLVTGFIGSKIFNISGEGILLEIVLGTVGAVVGGWRDRPESL